MTDRTSERRCECFGDSGLHASTHGDGKGGRLCDLCGWPVQNGAQAMTNGTWLILREPGYAPQRKGPFRPERLAETLREFMAARPAAFITVLRWGASGPDVQDGPECLEMIDSRSAPIARKHRRSTRAAILEHLGLEIVCEATPDYTSYELRPRSRTVGQGSDKA